MRYFAHIAFNGYNYRGWQNQVRVSTVQGTIEAAFNKVCGYRISCHGCGRTDAMVSASCYYFHFDLNNEPTFDLKYCLNRILPADIVVFDIFQVNLRNDAQHSAIERTYCYRLHTLKNPFIATCSTLYNGLPLNISPMQMAAELLHRHSNYTNFCQTPARHSSTMVSIRCAQLATNNNQTEIFFTITADRFLHAMVRIIVYRLLLVGQQQLSVEGFHELLHGNATKLRVQKAYPQGLSLVGVRYPFI